WGEKETKRLLAEKPWLRTPFYGLLELQMSVLPLLVRAFEKRAGAHPVLAHLPGFLAHVQRRVVEQGKRLGFVPDELPGAAKRAAATGAGPAVFARSQVARSPPQLEKIYIQGLGLG